MRLSFKRTLTALLVASGVVFSAAGAHAMGGGNANGPDAFIGIVGGSPQEYQYRGGGNGYPSGGNGYTGGGYQANTARQFGHTNQNGYGGYYRGW